MNKERLNRALSRLDSRTLPALSIGAVNRGLKDWAYPTVEIKPNETVSTNGN